MPLGNIQVERILRLARPKLSLFEIDNLDTFDPVIPAYFKQLRKFAGDFGYRLVPEVIG